MQSFHRLADAFVVAENAPFHYLQTQILGAQAAAFERIFNQFRESGRFQLRRGDIDGDNDFQALLAPQHGLLAGGLQRPFADIDDQATLLRREDELGGADNLTVGAAPAQQSLDANHTAAVQIDLRLVVELQLPGRKRLQHTPIDFERRGSLRRKLRSVDHQGIGRPRTRLQGQFRIEEQLLGLVAILRIEADPRAEGERDFIGADQRRLQTKDILETLGEDQRLLYVRNLQVERKGVAGQPRRLFAAAELDGDACSALLHDQIAG